MRTGPPRDRRPHMGVQVEMAAMAARRCCRHTIGHRQRVVGPRECDTTVEHTGPRQITGRPILPFSSRIMGF
jgi:hypothetical protein